ncbi:MAG: 2,3-bisphosphoglycerate-independent phosphoglycerate mutase [Solirubrobacterales bacterium]|nr:2,3-bisphosphoglycerate-independent phosphoglycerate mutase [Solirubrobacterales bacterium]
MSGDDELLERGAASLPAPCACLIVLDGWGLGPPGPGNAISLARTPVFDALWARFPHTTLRADGAAVGLPEGQMGNSEVGHLNLGAGAIVKQDLVRIDEAIAADGLRANEALAGALRGAERVHLLGLVSDGGVHSSLGHLRALIALSGELTEGADVVVHAFTDGRDTLPHSGAGFLAALEEHGGAGGAGGARVGSVVGRYFAMDRDRRWDRTQRAYDMLVHGRAPHTAESGERAVRAAYERGESDEFIEPTLVGEPARVGPNDTVICFNFRPDRMRQLVRALGERDFGERGEELPGWRGREGGAPLPPRRLTTLTEYEEDWRYPVAFGPERPRTTLAAVIARHGATQLHVAETEKYAHVTYFFNGGEEAPLWGEERELVPSPRDVPTYDHMPQMSAPQAAAAFVAAFERARPCFSLINFANADMVGHTGVIGAAVAAVETVDTCLREVVRAVHARGGASVVTADHGNSDHMLEPDGTPNTAHSLNPVPLILTADGVELARAPGVLADVAPTVLEALGIERPPEMTGRSLIARRA